MPYRISNESLEDWRSDYYHKYNAILDTMRVTDVIEAANIVARSLKTDNFYYIADYPLPHVGVTYLDKNKMGTCIKTSDYPVYVMRALGIPIAIDYYLESPRFSGGTHVCYVWKGHLYELFFHDGANGWQSLGRRKAGSNYLVYDNAPTNSVFLLKDLSKGREEQLFYYSAIGEQIFP